MHRKKEKNKNVDLEGNGGCGHFFLMKTENPFMIKFYNLKKLIKKIKIVNLEKNEVFLLKKQFSVNFLRKNKTLLREFFFTRKQSSHEKKKKKKVFFGKTLSTLKLVLCEEKKQSL